MRFKIANWLGGSIRSYIKRGCYKITFEATSFLSAPADNLIFVGVIEFNS